MRRIITTLCLALGATCFWTPHASADIHVGAILSLTGPAASLGIPERDAMLLWPKQVGGQNIKTTILDDHSDPKDAVLAARKLTSEEKVDVIVGPSITVTAIAILDVLAETGTPAIAMAGGGSITSPLEGARRWIYKMPPPESIPVSMILKHMKQNNAKTMGFIGFTDTYGEVFLKVMTKAAEEQGVKIVAVERYNRTDQSVTGQVLKLVAAKPDAIFIVASGTPGALPQIELNKRGYRGLVYQTQAIASNDFLRVGGKDVNGAFFPVAPVLVAEQLPESNPIRKVAMNFVKVYDGKYGQGAHNLFAATMWDAYIFLDHTVPTALKAAKTGTTEFRAALRTAIENTKELVVSTGVFTMSDKDHNGADERSQVMVRIENGAWKLVK